MGDTGELGSKGHGREVGSGAGTEEAGGRRDWGRLWGWLLLLLHTYFYQGCDFPVVLGSLYINKHKSILYTIYIINKYVLFLQLKNFKRLVFE